MTVDYSEIGNNIRDYRNKRKMKQLQLAELAGVTDQHISHIECGRTKVSLPTLLKNFRGIGGGSLCSTGNKRRDSTQYRVRCRICKPSPRYVVRAKGTMFAGVPHYK